MQCKKLSNYGRRVKKNMKIGKWLFIIAMAIMLISFFVNILVVNRVYLLIASLAIFGILLESASVFIDKADEYKERIRDEIISIVFKQMQMICKNGAFYSIYWKYRDVLVLLGVTDAKEQTRVREMLNAVIGTAIKQTGLKLQFEIDLKEKENEDEASKT